MNNRPRYNEGKRHEIVRQIMNNGVIPFRDIPLITENAETFQKAIHRMMREGVLQKYNKNNICFVTFKNYKANRNQIVESFPSPLVRYYEMFCYNDSRNALSNVDYRKQRIIRNAEAAIFCEYCGLESEIGKKPNLFGTSLPADTKAYYNSRELKGSNSYTMGRDISTQNLVGKTYTNGMIVSPGGTYLVIDVYNAMMAFDYGELSMNTYAEHMAAEKGLSEYKGVILLFKDYATQEKYLTFDRKYSGLKNWLNNWISLTGSYSHIYGININAEGREMLKRLITCPDWDKRIYSEYLSGKPINSNCPFVCDGADEESYYLCYCVPDLKKLDSFVRAATAINDKNKFKIICYESQKDFLINLTKGACRIYTTQ